MGKDALVLLAPRAERLSLGTGRLDGVNWDERIREQLANARDIVGPGLTGEEAVVADAVEARRQDMHQKAADELVRGKRHHLVVSLLAFETIILPLEGNVLVVGRDQAAVGDGDAVGVARKVAQHFLRSPEWALGIDDPVFVAQRRQIGREGSCVCERSVLAEELQLAGAMSDSKLLQDQPAEQARENTHVDEKVGPAGDPALTIGRDAAARRDHVDMRMVAPTPTIP